MSPSAHRVLARFMSGGLDIPGVIRSLAGVMKKGGVFSSPRQAALLWKMAKSLGQDAPFLRGWAQRYHTGENSFSTVLMALDPRFGRKDTSKIRYYAFAYVIDGAGVVAAAKVKINYPKRPDGTIGQPELSGIENTTFERKESAVEQYDAAGEARAHHQRVEKQRPLIEQIKNLPDYDKHEILESFVQQLEAGRELSPAQLGVIRKFMPVTLDDSQWRPMRDESFQLYENKLVEPAIRWFGQHSKMPGDAGEHAAWLADKIKDGWAAFKRKPALHPEMGGGGASEVSQLAEWCGWRKPFGATGALDVLARMQQLAAKGQKAPASVLKAVRSMNDLHEWLQGLSHGKLEHALQSQFG